jgi:hypothetical protein
MKQRTTKPKFSSFIARPYRFLQILCDTIDLIEMAQLRGNPKRMLCDVFKKELLHLVKGITACSYARES